MAELLLGQHCSLDICQQLDFLPITCQYCKKLYCKEHFLPISHQCPAPPPDKKDVSGAPPSRYPCSVEGCGKAELAPVFCPDCGIMICLAHRHQSDHNCSEFVPVKKIMTATKSLVENIVKDNKPVVRRSDTKVRSLKAQKMAAKVQLMKLKMKSTGDSGLPQGEKLYLLVTPPGGSVEGKGVWVSNTWVMGRVVDSIASLLSLENHNNIAGADKLKIFRRVDGVSLCEDMSEVVGVLVGREELYNGDTVVMEYVNIGVDRIENTS